MDEENKKKRGNNDSDGEPPQREFTYNESMKSRLKAMEEQTKEWERKEREDEGIGYGG